MLTFRGTTEDSELLARRILRLLRSRNAMHIGELRMRLGADTTVVQAELKEMMDRGEIERLRPLGYTGEDRDFYRANRSATVSQAPSDKWVLRAVQTGRDTVMRVDEAMALARLAD